MSLYSHCRGCCQGPSRPLTLVDAGGSHLLLAAKQTGQDDLGALGSCSEAAPGLAAPTVPGSFSHLGTLPRSLLMG